MQGKENFWLPEQVFGLSERMEGFALSNAGKR